MEELSPLIRAKMNQLLEERAEWVHAPVSITCSSNEHQALGSTSPRYAEWAQLKGVAELLPASRLLSFAVKLYVKY